MSGIFRDRPNDRIRHSLQRRARWVGTKFVSVWMRVTQVGVEVLVTDTSKVRTSQVSAEVLVTDTPKVRVSTVGVEVLMTINTATFVPHIFEDYV